MRIKIGDKFRDYMGFSYVVKKYEHQNITFEVDGGNYNDEVYSKKEFTSELDGNRFYIDKSEKLYTEEQMFEMFKLGMESTPLGVSESFKDSEFVRNSFNEKLKSLKKS